MVVQEVDFDPDYMLVDPSATELLPSDSDLGVSEGDSTISIAGKVGLEGKPRGEDDGNSMGLPTKRAKCSDFDLPDLSMGEDEQISGMHTAYSLQAAENFSDSEIYYSEEHCRAKPVFTVSAATSNKELKVVSTGRRNKKVRSKAVCSHLPRRNLQTCPLKSFTQKGKPMKHEFYVIKLTRKFVHSTKKALQGKWPEPKGLLTVLENPVAKNCMCTYMSEVAKYKDYIGRYVAPEYMPNSDCREVRKERSEFNSFSKGFLAYYMQLSPYLRVVFSLFCEVVFSGTPEQLCEAWAMECCDHLCPEECKRKWSELKHYTQNSLLKDLEVSPFPVD